MVVGGLGRDIELPRRFLGGMPGGNQPQHLDFARRQARQALGRRPARRLAGGGEDRLRGFAAELAFLDRAAQFRRRRRIAHRRAVGPCLPRGLERLRGGEDAGGGRKVGRLGVTVIAGAIETLMMAQHQRRNRLAVAAQRRQRALAMIGMKVRGVGLALGQGTGAHPGRDRHRKLADVMRVRGPAGTANVGRGKAHALTRRLGERRYGARMAEGEGHAHVDHVGDRQKSLVAALLVQHRVRRRFEREDRLAIDGPVEARHQPSACAMNRSASWGS